MEFGIVALNDGYSWQMRAMRAASFRELTHIRRNPWVPKILRCFQICLPGIHDPPAYNKFYVPFFLGAKG